jgi:hypothetical protein
MATERPGGNPEATRQAARHVYGPRHIGALVPVVARPVFRKRGAASAQLIADWAVIVGPALAAVTVPRRFASGTLSIACSGPIALELQHLTGELMGRINAHLGSAAVTRLRFVQEPAAALPAVAVPPPPPPRAVAKAESRVGDMKEGALRDALVALGSAVLTGR